MHHADPLFIELVGRLLYRMYNEDITSFDSMFMKNLQVHNYGTRQRDQYHIPGFKLRLGKINM